MTVVILCGQFLFPFAVHADVSTTPDTTASPTDATTSTDISAQDTGVQNTSLESTTTPASVQTTTDTATSSPDEQTPSDATNISSEVASTNSTSSVNTIGTSPDPGAGSPSPSLPPGDVTIQSGTAVALANILNLLNTSFVNSDGTILFANYPDSTGTIDARGGSNGICGANPCTTGQNILLQLLSGANITNTIVLAAISGQNVIENAQNAAIHTGDAIAGLNLINLANTTFANANYLIVTINAFRDVNGDIVLPNLARFLLGNTTSPVTGDLANSASVTNDVTTVADSGGNSVSTIDGSQTQTGNAQASTNVFNQLNSVLPGNAVSILLHVGGKWNGGVVNAPDTMQIVPGADGTYTLVNVTDSGTAASTPITVSGSTNATIDNGINVLALSGANQIANAGTAQLTTGLARAGVNIVNIANQQVIGRNWLVAIINIFGDFNGNIVFGQPDLWVGVQADAPSFIDNRSGVTYTYTVINNGDRDATGVRLIDQRDGLVNQLVDATISGLPENTGSSVWNIGTLPVGKAVQFKVHTAIRNSMPGQNIVDRVSATMNETDFNPADNTDAVILRAGGIFGGGNPIYNYYGDGTIDPTLPANLSVKRISSSITVPRNNMQATEMVAIHNASSVPARSVVLTDILKDASGTSLGEFPTWVGTVPPQSDILVTYGINFAASARVGSYSLVSRLSGANVDTLTYIPDGTVVITEPLLPVVPENLKRALISRNETLLPLSVVTGIDNDWTNTAGMSTTPKVPNTGSRGGSSRNSVLTAAAGSADPLFRLEYAILLGLYGLGICYLFYRSMARRA